jgi:Na+/proline symporter
MNTFTLGLIVIAYLLSLAYLGFLGYKKTTTASDYLVGGRQMNPIVMALSYGATFISASAIVGFGGVAAAFGMGIQWGSSVVRQRDNHLPWSFSYTPKNLNKPMTANTLSQSVQA